jgi:hypothetical protein
VATVAAFLAAACLTLSCTGNVNRLQDDRATDEARAQRSALTVLDGEQLEAAIATGASIPQILSTRISSLRIVREPSLGSNCPVFVLRGNSSIQQVTQPDYYVDHTRANDSCILMTLSASEVRAIEVYAAGASPVGMAMRSNSGGAVVLRMRVR